MREPVNDYEGSTRLRENRAYVKYYFDEYIDSKVTN